jgi:hypothetical protein
MLLPISFLVLAFVFGASALAAPPDLASMDRSEKAIPQMTM